MRVGYLLSSFDMLSVGDLSVIDQARQLCDQLVLGVLIDEEVERTFGRPPIIPLDERIDIVSHVRGVSRAVPHARDTAIEADSVFVCAVHGLWAELTDTVATVVAPLVVTQSRTLRNALRGSSAESVAS